MANIVISIDEASGDMQFLVSPDTLGLIDGGMTQRASHVEPVNVALRMLFYAIRSVSGNHGKLTEMTRHIPCLWRVNLSPVNGPILPTLYRVRYDAIQAEIEWLNVHFL
jgi:hypothetical protein